MSEGKHTRRELIVRVAAIQDLLGRIKSANSDRNPNRASDLARLIDAAHDLCIDTVGTDRPVSMVESERLFRVSPTLQSVSAATKP